MLFGEVSVGCKKQHYRMEGLRPLSLAFSGNINKYILRESEGKSSKREREREDRGGEREEIRAREREDPSKRERNSEQEKERENRGDLGN